MKVVPVLKANRSVIATAVAIILFGSFFFLRYLWGFERVSAVVMCAGYGFLLSSLDRPAWAHALMSFGVFFALKTLKTLCAETFPAWEWGWTTQEWTPIGAAVLAGAMLISIVAPFPLLRSITQPSIDEMKSALGVVARGLHNTIEHVRPGCTVRGHAHFRGGAHATISVTPPPTVQRGGIDVPELIRCRRILATGLRDLEKALDGTEAQHGEGGRAGEVSTEPSRLA